MRDAGAGEGGGTVRTDASKANDGDERGAEGRETGGSQEGRGAGQLLLDQIYSVLVRVAPNFDSRCNTLIIIACLSPSS